MEDNQREQKSALSEDNPKSIQYQSNKQLIKGILFCPCQCHTLALAIKDFRNNFIFDDMVSKLIHFSNLFRTREY